MSFEVKGLDKLKSKLKTLPSVLNEAAYQATFDTTEQIQGYAESNLASGMKHATGELLGSVKNETVVDQNGNIVGRVWSDKEQALYREFGTGKNGEESKKDLPPGIQPVYTQTPWFIPADKVDIDLEAVYGIPKITIQGVDFYRTNGQPARPWLYPAVKEGEKNAPEFFKRRVQEELKRGLK